MRFEKSDEDIVCVSAARTPFGRFGGSLREIDVYDLGAVIMKEAIDRAGIEPSLIGEVWWGVGDTTNTKDPYTPVVARQSLLIRSGLHLRDDGGDVRGAKCPAGKRRCGAGGWGD